MSKVGPKGNIVIDRRIREQLGVRPGWEVVQMLNESGEVVLHFLPPVEPGSVFGSLRLNDTSWLQTEEALNAAIEEAVQAGVEESDRAR